MPPFPPDRVPPQARPPYIRMEDWDNIAAPSQNQSTTSRGNSKQLVAANAHNQAIYNQIREEQKRLNLHSHVESQQAGDNRLLRPPDAPPMSRSATNESYASSNYSGSEDLHATSPTQGPATSGANNSGRRSRGRRKRPLLPETRFITAVKRKLKLTCQSHREKKTACDCYDFSALEAGWQRTQASGHHTHDELGLNAERERNRRRRASSYSSRTPMHLAPREPGDNGTRDDATGDSFDGPREHNNINFFGISGGGVPDSSSSPLLWSPSSSNNGVAAHIDDLDFSDPLQSPLMPPPPNIENFVNGFDANSLYLQHPPMQNSFGQPYYPGAYPVSPVSPVSPNPSTLLQPPPHHHTPRYQQPPHHQLVNQPWQQTQPQSPQYNSQNNTAALATTQQIRRPSRPQTQDDFIIIGSSQVLGAPASQSWKCGYSSSASPSSASSSVYNSNNNTNNLLSVSPPYTIATSVSCSWTGPLDRLAAHYETAHHAFENLSPEHRWSQCLTCDHTLPGWEDASGSWSEHSNPNCPSGQCFARGSPLRKCYYGSATLSDESADDQYEESLVSASAPSESAFSASGWNSNYGWGSAGSTAGSGVGADRYGAPWASYLSGGGGDGGGGCGGGGGGGYQQYPQQDCLGEGNDDDDDDKLLTDAAEFARREATPVSAAEPGRRKLEIYRAALASSSARLQPPSPLLPSYSFPSTCISTADTSRRSYRRDIPPPFPLLSHLRLLLRSLLPCGGSGSANAPRRLVLLIIAHCIISLMFPGLLPSLFCCSSPSSASSHSLTGLLARPVAWRSVVDWGGEVAVSYPPFTAAVAVAALAFGLVGIWVLMVAGRRGSARTTARIRGPVIPALSCLVPV